ncbi:DUF4238 domain-containing protein [Beijerinckia indica]|uniref:DUF4238 domain-containing protein n=1 Tax=Beijerinckia indica subsp. indica (strain ATCC 9039 / DSM 1715 / NCIMB 8712) TaxID=395963 RepID=B2IKP0_BEII9|nr:DUF4238 domain-containing protein [Beijerinckia indica]ACB95079.1 conserved hypothetical protein [Beijerinckia indica subsp. indica ATCC 9039]
MSEPRKHHYIPQFYLKNWCGEDGRLICYKRIRSEVMCEPVAPISTGFQKDLYTLAHLPKNLRQAIEKDVTADVDHRASVALQKMIATKSTDTLTKEDRLGWAQFIVSLPIRNPDAVADIKETSTKAGLEKAYEQAKQEFPDWAQGETFGAEFEESVREDPFTRFLSDNYGLMVISELMLNPDYHDIILKMFWWVMDFSSAGISLITCDRPYMIFRSIGHPRGLIYLPIGPRLGFFASPDPMKRRQLLNQNIALVTKEMNRWEAKLAAQYVYAADRHHTPLIMKYLRAA